MALPPPGPRRDLAIALLFTLAAAAFRLPRLGTPGEEVFDEVYHAKTALQYLNGESPTEWVHPPTAKLLIAVGVWLFGYVPWAWRLLPALAGVALAPVFYLLARRVLVTERAAVLATVLLLCDGVYLVQSRIAMTNIFAVLFQVSAALFILRAALRPRLSALDMAAAGLFLGLALSTRWTSLWAAGFLGLVLLAVRRLRIIKPRELTLTVLAFLVLPVGIYVLSYVPWMRQGHELRELLPLQKAIWRYHADLRATHPYFSRWYTWPLLYRPTWYYFKQTGETIRGIVALGNPALWWASVPVTVWALVTGAKEKDPRRLFSGLGFCAMYLPWGISPRTLNYSHYLFEAIPYACLSLGGLLDRGGDGKCARVYVALVVVLFFFFLPFLIALPIPARWYFHDLGGGVRPWTWFPKWV
ncbi:MAG TPA: phospholipid carrier-dependent glycosyltransferase [Vicinamibacteria bacterium]